MKESVIEQFVTDILHKQSATKILLKYRCI